MVKFIALGGDGRTEFMARCLSENGFYTEKSDNLCNFENYSAAILPLPFTTDNVNIKGTDIKIDDFIGNIPKNSTVFIGKSDKCTADKLKNKNVLCFDYNARDEFAQKNAVPTAQGVLAFVLDNTRVTVSSLKIAVIGYGRCGKAVCRIFKSLGADVTSFSRRYSTVADAESDGINACLIKNYAEKIGFADIIVNTVPEKILGREFIDKTNKNAILIDISSFPYGFDLDYAESAGRKVNILPSLPGKCVPETAGKIIAETIINIIEEGGLWKKSS